MHCQMIYLFIYLYLQSIKFQSATSQLTKHKDSKRYVPIWDLRGGGHVIRARRPDATNYTPT